MLSHGGFGEARLRQHDYYGAELGPLLSFFGHLGYGTRAMLT
jgi:hypothetical protein